MITTHYTPDSDLTIEQAINKAVLIAKTKQQNVLADINDIIVNITPKTDKAHAMFQYYKKLQERFEADKLRQNKQTKSQKVK